MTKLFRKLFSFNAAEASVISFILMSLIGGGALYYTESGRIVNAKEPVLQVVNVIPAGELGEGVQGEAYEQIHVFTKDIAYKGETFIDSLFTAVSALCVTGLTSTDFSQFTLAGQIIVLILIQMGGWGIILFTSIFALAVVRGFSERIPFKNLLPELLDTNKHQVGRMLMHVTFYTILFEGLAFLIMGSRLSGPETADILQGVNPWWWALFHSISAFNNAGFGLMNNNLMSFVVDPVINLTIAILIILGGLGYPVLIAIHAASRRMIVSRYDARQLQLEDDVKDVTASVLQTKIAIMGTLTLLLIGTAFMLFVDWNNPIMADYSVSQKILIGFFQSVSTRTAGFNTVDIGALHIATLFVFIILMYIGANPAGTAGGIKIPTVAVLYGYIKDWFKAPGMPVELFGRKVSKFAVSHAVRLFFFSILFIAGVTILMLTAEKDYLITPDPTFNLTKILFEIVSAFGTVGLSMGFPGGVTSFSAILTPFSKTLLILTMLFGRLGPLTWLAALPWKRKYQDAPLSADFEGTDKIQIG